jgi:hypothetical protein
LTDKTDVQFTQRPNVSWPTGLPYLSAPLEY